MSSAERCFACWSATWRHRVSPSKNVRRAGAKSRPTSRTETIVLSGDADYLPPISAVKRKGKLVYSVSFLDRQGRQLPGGARRLSNAVDARLDIPFEAVRSGLGVAPLVLHDHAIA
jgi:hypothetical protein